MEYACQADWITHDYYAQKRSREKLFGKKIEEWTVQAAPTPSADYRMSPLRGWIAGPPSHQHKGIIAADGQAIGAVPEVQIATDVSVQAIGRTVARSGQRTVD